MGLRRKPRVKMVVPVRLWGTDSAGNPFNILAHTLNVSSTGARVGGVKVGLAVGEAITLQYKQQRALFKIAWIGRPGDKTEQQIGIHLLEQDRQIWTELQDVAEYVDGFAGHRRTPPAVASAPPAAAPQPAQPVAIEELEAAEDAPVARAPGQSDSAIATLVSDASFSDPNEMMRACARGLLSVDERVRQQPPDPEAIQEFRDALAKVRQTVWALQQWHEAKTEGKKGFPLLSYLNTERLRFMVQATHDLAEDIATKGVEVDPGLLESLFRHVDKLRSKGVQASEFTVEVVPPDVAVAPAAPSPMLLAVRTAAADARRSGMKRDETLQFLARELQRILGIGGIALARRDGGEMVCEASSGNAAEPGMVLETESGIGAEAVRTRAVAYCADTQTDQRVDAELCREANIGAVVMLPVLALDGGVSGMIEASASRANAFGDEHLTVLSEVAKLIAPLVASKSAAV